MEATTMHTLPVDTSVFPAVWRHGDNDTACSSPELCERMGRFPYVRGGREGFGTLAE